MVLALRHVGLRSLATSDLGALAGGPGPDLQLGGGGAAERGFLALGGWVEHTPFLFGPG